MGSLGQGEANTAANPVLDLFTAVGNPPVLTDVLLLDFRILDISTAAKKVSPVQVFPLTAPPSYFTLDPTAADPVGHRLSTGRYFAEYTVDPGEPIGDHQIEWRFQLTALTPQETFFEEFFVTASVVANPDDNTYCTVAEVRAEGHSETSVGLNPVTGLPMTAGEFDSRVLNLIRLASRTVDKVTGRWFHALAFDDTNRLIVDGKSSRTVHLEIPIIRVDKLFVENQGLLGGQLTEISLAAVRIYNRHISGLTQPDDRENPKISFIQTRILTITADGLFPPPRMFALGRQSVHLEGLFGYTDPDGTSIGVTPALIRRVTCLLVARELLFDVDACEKLNVKQKFRISSDKQDKTTIRLQDIWLKGAITGDSEIDTILMMYKRPSRMAAV